MSQGAILQFNLFNPQYNFIMYKLQYFYKCENWGRENLVNLTGVSQLVVADQALKCSNVNSDVWTLYYLLIITSF